MHDLSSYLSFDVEHYIVHAQQVNPRHPADGAGRSSGTVGLICIYRYGKPNSCPG
jgi:hypothetical protein